MSKFIFCLSLSFLIELYHLKCAFSKPLRSDTCKYFSPQTAEKTYQYIAPDVCFSQKSDREITAEIYKCSDDGDSIYYYTFNNVNATKVDAIMGKGTIGNESDYCSNMNDATLNKVYSKSDSSIVMNCDGKDCSTVLRTYNGCDTSKDDYQELCIVSNMCGIVNKGTVKGEKFICDQVSWKVESFQDDKCVEHEGSEHIRDGCSEGLQEYNQVLSCHSNT